MPILLFLLVLGVNIFFSGYLLPPQFVGAYYSVCYLSICILLVARFRIYRFNVRPMLSWSPVLFIAQFVFWYLFNEWGALLIMGWVALVFVFDIRFGSGSGTGVGDNEGDDILQFHEFGVDKLNEPYVHIGDEL